MSDNIEKINEFFNGEKYNTIIGNYQIDGKFTDSNGKFRDVVNNGILTVQIFNVDNNGNKLSNVKINFKWLDELKNYLTNMGFYETINDLKKPHSIVYSDVKCLGINILNVKLIKSEKMFEYIIKYFQSKLIINK